MRKRRKCDVLQRSRFEVGDGEIRRGKATGKEKESDFARGMRACGRRRQRTFRRRRRNARGARAHLCGGDFATAIAVILPLCLVSTVVYAVRGTFDYSVLPPTIAGVLIGGLTGAVALKKLSAPVLNFLFYGLMLFAGVKMMM